MQGMASEEPSPVRPGLVELASVFTRYANLTFGGGSATIAVIKQQIVERRRWMSELQFNLSYALSRLTPGTNLLAFCTAAGWTTRRWPGALVVLIASSLPCSIIAVLVTCFYEAWQHNPIVLAALKGAMASTVAIMFYSAWIFASPHIKASVAKAIVIIPVTLVLALKLALSPVHILLLAAALGLLWPDKQASK